MSPSDFDPELEELHRKSVVRLLAAEVFDQSAFDQLYDHLAAKANLIKTEHVVSKQVLNSLVSVEGAIRSRAEYVSAAREALPLIDRFTMLLHLIAIGESPADRVPGQPRIV